MSDPIPPAADPAGSPTKPGQDDSASWVRRQLGGPGAARLLRYIGRTAKIVRAFAVFVVLVGILAAVLGVLGFREHTAAMVVVVLLSLPAIVAPIMAIQLTTRMAASARQPDVLVRQAQDLARGLVDSAELRQLARRLTGGAEGEGPITQGRLGRARHTAKLASTVMSQAKPDKERHPLLVPFRPERLRWLSMAYSWSWIGFVIAVFVALASFFMLLTTLA